ncbi:MAG: hypothetical protein ACHQNE_03050 [Candidatus Kapaibacterium sp.]
MKRDSFLLRVIIFVAMSAIFFLFLKITERKIPHGIAPDTTLERSADTTQPAAR